MADTYRWQDDGIKAVDPYEDWLLDTGVGYGFPFGPPDEAHCYTGTEASDNFVAGDENPDAIYPTLYRPDGEQPSFRPFVLRESTVGRQYFSGCDLGHSPPETVPGTTEIKRRIGVPLRAASVNQSYAPDQFPDPSSTSGQFSVCTDSGSSGAKVVIGVIDDGIAIANRRFQSELGSTRIDFAWVQDGEAESDSGSGVGSGTSSGVAFGCEYTKSVIDGALAEHTDALGATNEAALYRSLGLVDSRKVMPNSLDGKAAHGTHVLDLAAGADYESMSSDALDEDRIITVQVPAAVTWDTSGMGLDSFILAGVHYILDRADRIAPNLPVVINFSYGIFGGPHDGTSMLEKAIDEIVTARNDRVAPTSVVLPSGNHHLERSHAVITDDDFKADDCADTAPTPATAYCDLPWRVQPNDRTSSYLEIWMPKSGYDDGDIEVEVILPITEEIPSQKLTGVVDSAVVLTRGTKAIARLSYDRHTPLSEDDERGRFMLTLAPTEVRQKEGVRNAGLKAAPNGLWTVRVIKRLGKDLPASIHARIQRDASPFGYPALGRQSYFDDGAYRIYDREGKLEVEDNHSIVKRAGASNGLATGEVPVVVGGHVEETGRAALYSGYQTTDASLPEQSTSPFVSAESDRSPVFRGVRASGVNSGVSVALDGTSVAAPTITRAIANAYKTGVATTPVDELQAQAIAIEATRQAKGYFTPLDPDRQGVGRFPLGEIYGS